MNGREIIEVVADQCSAALHHHGFTRLNYYTYERTVDAPRARRDRFDVIAIPEEAERSVRPPWEISADLVIEFPDVSPIRRKLSPSFPSTGRIASIFRNIGYLTERHRYRTWHVHDFDEAAGLAATFVEALPNCESGFWERFGTFDRIKKEFESSEEAMGVIDDDLLIAIEYLEGGADRALDYLRNKSRMAIYSRNHYRYREAEAALEEFRERGLEALPKK